MDHSPDQAAPPFPAFDPSSRDPSTQSLYSPTNGTSEYRNSRRESRRSIHSEIELRVGQIHNSWQAERRRAEIAERRAEDAERKLQEFAAHFKAVNDARLSALRDAGRANEELKLYRLQLDHAQQEIYRAQDTVSMVDRQRHTAELDAANHRSKIRELQKTVLIQITRDEAYRKGLEEGLARGRELVTVQFGDPSGEDNFQDSGSDSESQSPPPDHDHRSRQDLNPTKPRSIAPSEHSRAPIASPLPVPLPSNPPNPSRSRAPSLHPSENNRPLSIRAPSVHPSENIRPKSAAPSVQHSPSVKPVSIRNVAPAPLVNNAAVPPDNLIPSLDADNRIRLPPPFEFHKTPERPTADLPQSTVSGADQDALPIRPRSSSNATNATLRRQRQSGHQRNISSGSSSSALSALDILNNKPLNTNLRTPMSIIPEVNSAYSGSPRPESPTTYQLDRQRSVPDYSAHQYQAPPSVVPTGQHSARPPSRSSYAASWQDQQQQKRDSRISTSTIPNIDVQPPSKPVSQKSQNAESIWGGASVGGGGSPSMTQRPSLPNHYETDEAPPEQYPPSTFSGMPGGYTLANQVPSSEPPVIPRSSGYDWNGDDDDAVSSSMSADTLTTPLARRQTMEADWSGSPNNVRAPSKKPTYSKSSRLVGSSNTTFWAVGPETDKGAAASIRSKKSSKGSLNANRCATTRKTGTGQALIVRDQPAYANKTVS